MLLACYTVTVCTLWLAQSVPACVFSLLHYYDVLFVVSHVLMLQYLMFPIAIWNDTKCLVLIRWTLIPLQSGKDVAHMCSPTFILGQRWLVLINKE